tara:strand:- start:23681 stop:24694 length:1014 start_codon:yes stop_codon:yes gene_type:complete
MKKKYFFIIIIKFGYTTIFAQDKKWVSNRPDSHAPISVMGDHYHSKGEIMFSYRFMSMNMSDNLQSSKSISDNDIFNDYMVAPQNMQMQMHMLGAMYAPSDKLTVMLMANYLSNIMDSQSSMGSQFTTKSQGFGDSSIALLYNFFKSNSHSLHTNVGLSIPTGSISKTDNTPMMNNVKLAYQMQLGSGTWDPFIGLTYLGQSNSFSWGGQTIYKVRPSKNKYNYKQDNSLTTTGWGAIKVSNSVSLSTSLSYSKLNKIQGNDEDFNPMMMPLFNTANSGNQKLDAGLGLNYFTYKGGLKNLRFGAEIKKTIFQKVNGIQMKYNYIAVLGIQYVLGHK